MKVKITISQTRNTEFGKSTDSIYLVCDDVRDAADCVDSLKAFFPAGTHYNIEDCVDGEEVNEE